MAGWPQEQWATLLAPYLTGTAKTAYRALALEEARDYVWVKLAILDALAITPETFHRQFWTTIYLLGTQPRIVAQAIKDLCW